MNLTNDTLELSASDLSNHIACNHLSFLNLSMAKREIAAPEYRDPMLALLQERGQEFEDAYLNSLREQGKQVDIVSSEGGDETAFEHTVAAMRAGKDVIYQGTLRSGRWLGRADFLERVERPSTLGAWSYEVVDSKLAKETRAGTLLQLCLYAELVAEIQGVMPEYVHVITPEDGFKRLSYRVDDYLAYYRLVKRNLERFVGSESMSATYPVPVLHCDICRWWQSCTGRRRADDHLSLVAGLANTHAKQINGWQVNTLAGFAQMQLPLPKPAKGAKETYARLREQARVQLEAREKEEMVYECLPLETGRGLARLPEPSQGDVFFDFEGDPFAGTSGMEYLFGFVFEYAPEQYHSYWAFSPEQEKAAFESFMDLMMENWERNPDFHIYHFTGYETGALKRLAGKYGTREEEVDRLLRGQRFVDLHSITRQALRAGVETYSLKELEQFHGFIRQLELREASSQLRLLEGLLERNNVAAIADETKQAVEQYNKEDCLSTRELRVWLEHLRSEQIRSGSDIPRPALGEGMPSEGLTEYQEKIKPVFDALIAGFPADRAERTEEQQARWLLAHMLDWYRREKKTLWWEYFRLTAMPDEELLEEKSALSGLQFTGQRVPEKRSVIDTYVFPVQDGDLKPGDSLFSGDGERLGEVMAIDLGLSSISIKKGPSKADLHPTSIFKDAMINQSTKEAAVFRMAEWVATHGIDAEGDYQAGRDLLLNHLPRTAAPFISDKHPQEKAVEWVLALDNGVLPIQGPPGAGKSHTAANMIISLIQSGKKVGITALSHKVIVGLMQKVLKFASDRGIRLHCIKAGAAGVDDSQSDIIVYKDNGTGAKGAAAPGVQLVGGTPFLWSREDMTASVDVLFVDEAGQLSLIDTVAVSQAAKSLVLLGDPQQLKQPQQGSHPEGTEVSALEHILQGMQTITPDKGIFLDETWRLHPSICAFVSELFYENKLHSRPELAQQSISGNTRFNGSGLWFEGVAHVGNQNSAVEEVEHVAEIIQELAKGDVIYTDTEGKQHTVGIDHIKVIAPYNAQVALLKNKLPDRLQVGTVDKFQGQEAPIVILSLATSSPEDAPRGMEFLYSLNRLNVAVSRAKAIFILVGNPSLFEPDCRSVQQMKLANAFCRYLEMTNSVNFDS
ncbi:MAG: TM0106 family RecB-like putative nuclease [Parapedobacter sp.]|nr:MAG: TM0106 family RecB-like putative nuclease [Parapedobacter sp.]